MNNSDSFSKKLVKLLAASIVNRMLPHTRAAIAGFELTNVPTIFVNSMDLTCNFKSSFGDAVESTSA